MTKGFSNKNFYIPYNQTAIQLVNKNCLTLTLFRMDFFRASYGWGVGQKDPPSLKSVTHTLQ